MIQSAPLVLYRIKKTSFVSDDQRGRMYKTTLSVVACLSHTACFFDAWPRAVQAHALNTELNRLATFEVNTVGHAKQNP